MALFPTDSDKLIDFATTVPPGSNPSGGQPEGGEFLQVSGGAVGDKMGKAYPAVGWDGDVDVGKIRVLHLPQSLLWYGHLMTFLIGRLPI